MLLLASTSDLIQVDTGVAVNVDVHASYIDYNGTTVTPGRKNTAITTATTTSVVASPGASTTRNVKTLTIRNKNTTTPVPITVTHYDGTTTIELHSETLGPNGEMSFVEGAGFVVSYPQRTAPAWWGNIAAAYGDGNPQKAWQMATQGGSIAATPTNITASIARISYFRLEKSIVVNKLRYYGTGTVAAIFKVAIYNGDTLSRLTADTTFSTTANVWGEVFSALALTLTAGQLYFIACAVSTTGATAGPLCMGTTVAATTGQLQVLPKSAPGNLDIDNGFHAAFVAQFAVTAGALPNPAATIAAQSAWTGGMPLFFLDNSNA